MTPTQYEHAPRNIGRESRTRTQYSAEIGAHAAGDEFPLPSSERVPSFFLAHSGLGCFRLWATRGSLGTREQQEKAALGSLGTRPINIWPLGLGFSLGILKRPSSAP